MSPVPANTVGTMLIEQHVPYLTPDLEDYLQAIGSMFAEVDELVAFEDEEGGWSALLDPDRCPARALPHLAMYVGERLPIGLDEAMQREWIRDAPNQRRGTLMSIVRAVQRTLTGNRSVSIVERSGTGETHPEDYITVTTYLNETPDPQAVIADIYTVLPADIELEYSTLDGQNWSEVSTYTWNALMSAYDSWHLVQSDTPGWGEWDRPRPI